MAARSSRSDPVAVDPALPYKRRARRRLLGAVVVVSIVVAGVPFVLDSEPTLQRPEVVLDIPSRDTPLPVGGSSAPETAAAGTAAMAAAPSSPPAGGVQRNGGSAGAAGPGSAAPAPGAGPGRTQPAPPPPPLASPPPPVSARPPSAAQPPAPATPPVASAAERPPPAVAPATGRWVVQTGLFGRAENATALVVRIRGIGLPVYTESFDSAQGPRVRVRVGPFASRVEADEARARLSLNGIEATLVAL